MEADGPAPRPVRSRRAQYVNQAWYVQFLPDVAFALMHYPTQAETSSPVPNASAEKFDAMAPTRVDAVHRCRWPASTSSSLNYSEHEPTCAYSLQ